MTLFSFSLAGFVEFVDSFLVSEFNTRKANNTFYPLSWKLLVHIPSTKPKEDVFWTRILASLFHHWWNNYCSMYESFGKVKRTEQTVAASSSRNRRWRHAGNNFTGKHYETKKISSRTRPLLRYLLRSWIHFFSKDVFSTVVPNQNHLAPRYIVKCF